MDSPHVITLTVGLIILVCMAWVSGYIWRDTNVAVRLSSVASCFLPWWQLFHLWLGWPPRLISGVMLCEHLMGNGAVESTDAVVEPVDGVVELVDVEPPVVGEEVTSGSQV